MKKLLKDRKKGGSLGRNARRRLRFMAGGAFLLLLMAAISFAAGGVGGTVFGVLTATVPILSFTLPEGHGLSDKEAEGLKALGSHWTKEFNKYLSDKMSSEELKESMGSIMLNWAKKNGISGEKLEGMEKALKEQGQVLEQIKERETAGKAKLAGLKGAFFKNFEQLQKAIKDEKVGYTIKAVDEHDPDLIHTTDNIISTTSGATLAESIGANPNLFLKRRDRQYIRDIANVSVVEEVPEVFSFYEEGDEEGSIAIVTENGLKPQIHLGLIKNQADRQKAAGYIVVTEEVIKWRSRAWAAILRLFRDKVVRDYENILTTQMLTNATSYIATPLDGTIDNPTDFEAIIAAILQLEQLNFQPDTLVINPADKWRLAMTTTDNGMFILPYIQNSGQFGLLGLRVITTNKVAAGTFLLGESGTWFIEEEDPQLRTGLVNDDLIHNRMTIVGEIFFLSYVPSNNAGAWINGNFADIKEALATTTP